MIVHRVGDVNEKHNRAVYASSCTSRYHTITFVCEASRTLHSLWGAYCLHIPVTGTFDVISDEGGVSHLSPKANDVYKSAFNEYTIKGSLGSGGAGTVYAVTDLDLQPFALKEIDPSRSNSQRRKRFKNEMLFCENHHHANIIKVLDYGRGPSGEPFYVMPLFEMTLQKAMVGGRVPANNVLPVFAQILTGVEAAHLKNVTHRDLKPQNILCNADLSSVVIADFGIASFEEDDLYTAVETRQADRLANFQYAAPEQRARGRDVTSKADIYALGLILNEMFTGDIPLGTGFTTVASVAPNYAFLDGLIEAMIKQDPEQRPSIALLRQELASRETQFASQQKIDRLTQEVVPEETLDDPLIRHPVTLVNVDYQREELIFKLSSSPNFKWIEQFHNRLSGITSFVGMGPGSVSFRGSVARIACAPRDAQMQIDYFKDWLMKANQSYAARIAIEAQEARQQEQKKRESTLAEERKRQELLKRLKW